MVIILYIIVGFMCLVLPLVLTTINIINLFKRKKRIKENLVDILTFVFGIILTVILYIFHGFKDYNEALTLGGVEISVHAPIASWSMPTVIAILVIGIISYILVRIKKLDMPPIIIICSMSGIFLCTLFIIMFFIQMFNENTMQMPFTAYLLIFPLNYILCSIRAIIDILKKYKEKDLKPKEYKNKFLNMCSKIICNIYNWPILAIIFVIPLVIILISILVLFGQRPDEAIKAFLETSDWTLSAKNSPPDIVYDGHYLCTVSLRGHEKLVKPLRMGIRKGEKIVVNRQLCVANAFEDLIQERTPKFHHLVRHIYDKYGFPISKYINTPVKADITYILMKPLEWIFLLTLYLFDKKPENRIATQYIGNAKKVFN